ncbi:MAG TPA: glycosyltransferase family 2 protein [Bacteroidia bacterium]|jgi:glycosyltransferase involved in cell wall biosynthesis|nr:glycosyltransferase family 2 protein [Bacteroidia bacterium]
MPKLSIIIPCYYNEENIPVTGQKLMEMETLLPVGTETEYVFVDDGSKDNTLQALLDFKGKYPDKVRVVKLAGNVGSYNALVAGMEFATGDCLTVISADLQDPPELIPKMYDYWLKGIKFVVASRTDRQEPFFSKAFSNLYHSLIKRLALSNIPKGGFDFVLFDRKLKDELLKMREKDTNSLYLLAWMNFEMVSIPYSRNKREIGKSRWTMKKKIKLFIDSFVSFSFFPLRLITVLGFIIGFVALIYSGIIIAQKISGKVPVSGWSSMMLIILLTSSFQMIAIGILGEYLWRVLEAARNRPLYVVEKVYE